MSTDNSTATESTDVETADAKDEPERFYIYVQFPQDVKEAFKAAAKAANLTEAAYGRQIIGAHLNMAESIAAFELEQGTSGPRGKYDSAEDRKKAQAERNKNRAKYKNLLIQKHIAEGKKQVMTINRLAAEMADMEKNYPYVLETRPSKD